MTRPIYLGGSHWGHFEPVLGALSRVFDSGFPTDQRSRLFRSLEWFRFAHTEATSVSLLQKVGMMVTAYEILLDFPNWGKKRYFIKQVDDQLRLPESRLVQVKDKDGTTFCVCPAAQWAADFYNLRNDITHGDEVPYERLDYKGWVSHLTVADVVFLELVERMLYRHGCIGQHLRERVAELAPLSSDPPEALEAALLPGICGLNLEDVHEALGWIPPLAERCADFEE